MHPLLQITDTATTKLAQLCDTTKDVQLRHELATIGLAFVAVGESMEYLLHLLAHVPEDVRLKAAEDAKACSEHAETTEPTIAHTKH